MTNIDLSNPSPGDKKYAKEGRELFEKMVKEKRMYDLNMPHVLYLGKSQRGPKTTGGVKYTVSETEKSGSTRYIRSDMIAQCAPPHLESLAAWMIEHGFATGHGDTIEGLLRELSWQVKELKKRNDQ